LPDVELAVAGYRLLVSGTSTSGDSNSLLTFYSNAKPVNNFYFAGARVGAAAALRFRAKNASVA
jgi:hypothetical protein